jgi:hypothetical protein
MKGGVEVYFHAFLTSVLDGGEWSDSNPGRFTPTERAPVFPLYKVTEHVLICAQRKQATASQNMQAKYSYKYVAQRVLTIT